MARCSRRHTVPRNSTRLASVWKGRQLWVGPGVDVGEAGPLEALGCLLGGRVEPRAGPLHAERPHGFDDARDVPRAAALRDELAARPQDAMEVGEQPVVVGDPVEGGRGQHGVDRASARRGRAGDNSDRSAWTKLTLSPAVPRRACACSSIDGEASRATTWPRGSRASSSSVTRPVPQPASTTVSSPSSSRRSSTARPHRACGADTRS